MSSEKKTLFEIATTKLDDIVDELKNHSLNIGLVFNSKQISEIKTALKDRLSARKKDFVAMERELPSDALRLFLREPQINDSLVLFAVKSLIAAEFNIKKGFTVLKDDLYTYIFKAIEISYPILNSDQIINTLESFLNSLLEVCEEKTETTNFTLMFSESLISYIMKFADFIVIIIEDKIKRILSKEFLCRNKDFETIRIESNKLLQMRFQNDFIYLLGEHRFADFYIPPNLQVMNQIGGFPVDYDVNQPERTENLLLRIYGLLEERNNLENQTHREQWKDIFLQHSILYLIGGTGYGKSLFLKNIVNNYSKMHFNHAEDYLVIHCDLKSYYSRLEIHRSLPDFFHDSMVDLSGSDSLSKEIIQHYIYTGRCLVLLDALDEVPKAGRQELHKKIISYFQTYNPENKVCITSRSIGFIPEKHIEAIEILPLNKGDIEEYLDKMIALKKFKREDKQRFLEQAQILIDRKFLSSFLVLSILVNIYKAERELPENKIDLYKKCFEYIAKKRGRKVKNGLRLG